MSEKNAPRRAAPCLVLALLLAGCPDTGGPICEEACGRGLECDLRTAQCVPTALPSYERALPGRAVRVAAAGRLAFTASVDPSDGALVLAEHGDGGSVDARILTTFDRAESKRLALAATPRLVAVAWLGDQGRYEIAYRSLPRDDNATWRFVTVPEPDGSAYIGTEGFDLEVVGADGLGLAFRDLRGALRILQTASLAEGGWTLEDIDTGGPADDGTNCPPELRRAESAPGVGIDPDLAVRDETLVVAYQDADCGDLRVARRVSRRWSIAIADAGDLSLEVGAARGIVGRWPSVDIGPGGVVAVAYHDVSRGRLLYAREIDGRYEIEVVDAGFEIDAFSRERKDVVGAFARLSRADDGNVTITYFDGTELDLEMAQRTSPTAPWTHRKVESEGAVGFFADHVRADGAGRFIAAERLVPRGGGGFESSLFVEREGP